MCLPISVLRPRVIRVVIGQLDGDQGRHLRLARQPHPGELGLELPDPELIGDMGIEPA